MIETFSKYIENKDNNYIIFDIGSRDCAQSIEFYNKFPNAKIYAFECNANTLNICKKNIENYKDRITLIEGAVCDYDGNITFYPINQQKTQTTWADGNPGASSLFKSNGNYTIEKYIQDETTIPCYRLDTIMKQYNIPKVDIIWMDLQGAELLALKGLGNYIETVEYIHTEVTYKEMYSGQVMFKELNDYIVSKDFSIVNTLTFQGWQEDAIYKKSNTRNTRNTKNIEKFTNIYENSLWGNNLKTEYNGSSGDNDGNIPGTRRYIIEKYIQKFILENNIKTVVDLGHGDFLSAYDNIYKDLNITYIGYDAYEKMSLFLSKKYKDSKYKFIHLDFIENKEKIESGDLCIIKDILQHLEIEEIYTLLDYLYSSNKFKYILISNCCNQEVDDQKLTGTFRPLNSNFLPLKKYNPKNLLNFNTKEILLIEPNKYDIQKEQSLSNMFDIVIPIGPNDINVIETQIKYTKKNIIGYRNIYLVCYDPSINIEGCITINENIFPFNIETIAKFHGKSERNGWYLQQLIKLYSGNIIPNILQRYLVIDCDTFFLKPTIFIEKNKCLYNFGTEYNAPYFTHMSKLDKNLIKIDSHKSGICHHMMFENTYINELFCIVENNHKDKFYNIFLKFVTEPNLSGASEYEIYFNFILKNHADKIQIRELKWKNSNKFINDDNNDNMDYISYHWYMRNNS